MSARKLIVGTVTALAAFGSVGATSAAADAQNNGSNCLGAVVSGVSPEFVSQPPGAFGQTVSGQGQAGIRDDFVHGFVEAFCPAHP